jgi:hypothetical protein
LNKVIKAQNSYNHVFNPMNGFVHESEKPLRDELFTPTGCIKILVSLTRKALTVKMLRISFC